MSSQPQATTLSRLLKRASKRGIVLAGAAILLVLVVSTFAVPMLSSSDAMQIAPWERLRPPSWEHPFGTDRLGRDLLVRTTYGGRISFLIGGCVMALAMTVGTILGVGAGFSRRLDEPVMRTLDGVQAFPSILLALALVAVFGVGLVNVIVALAAVAVPPVARVVRSSVLVARELGYSEAARAVGSSQLRTMLRHILPNCVSPVVVQGTFVFARAVLDEAALTFLGVGVPPTTPSWGTILSEGRDIYAIAYWHMVFPGLFIIMSVFAINMVGDGLRDIFDPYVVRNGTVAAD